MTDSTDNALKPCPFCGSHGIDRDTYWHRDYCTNCGGKGPAAGNSPKADWNTRTRVDLAPDPLRAVKVRALEWTQYCSNAGNSSAPAFGGEYICERAGDDGNYGLWLPWDGPADDPRGYYEELAAAKAAAQQDYETRIRSALEPDPLADARVWALVEAATDMATVAHQDDWHKAMTGRQIILRNLDAALAAFDNGGKTDG